MSKRISFQKQVLGKLGIKKLNPMQEEAILAINSSSNTILLSPTGTGKTLGFLMPILSYLNKEKLEIQAIIILPSRELAIQIEQVIRNIGSGFKANAVYGGRSFSKDKIELKHPPAILVGTPGRIADHLRRETFSTDAITTIVLDEFDKSLEIGFETEMKEIIAMLPNINKRILTSATQGLIIPKFVGLENPLCINYLGDETSKLKLKTIESDSKDKLQTLVNLLCHKGNEPGIVFCNFKDTIQRVSDFLNQNSINHGCFYGDMEQMDREKALIKFRNGTHQIILATDLAARGIDIPQLKYIVHYQLPTKHQEFTHRNGRTARMNAEGTAYILKWKNENLPDFIQNSSVEALTTQTKPKQSGWKTLWISGGRKDKISKGDIAGLFFKQGQLSHGELGLIELKNDCAFAAVSASKVDDVIASTNNCKLKKVKIRVTLT